jgi:Disulphide bond corrector protein DsbC
VMNSLRALVVLALLATGAYAQNWYQGAQKPQQWVDLVSAPQLTVKASGSAKATLQFRVKPDLHINSHTPHSDLLIPTELIIAGQPALQFKPAYPAGHDITLPFDSEKLSVYTGDFSIDVNATAKGLAGKKTVPAELKYQACNNSSCFPPKSLKFDLEVQVAQ